MENESKKTGNGFHVDKRFLGSNIALVFGILSFLGGLVNPNSGLIAGAIMILGSLAYKSAKKRMLGLSAPSSAKQTLEILAIVAILLIVLLQNNIKVLMINDPVPNLIIPVYALVAYIVIFSHQSQKK